MTSLVLGFALFAPSADPTPVPAFPSTPPLVVSVPPPQPPTSFPAAPALRPPASWAEAQLPCPGPLAHPFQRLPRVALVLPTPIAESSDAKCGTPKQLCPPWTMEFHQAAHFPLPRFTIDGCPVATDGLLIYEGMRLTVYDDGTYDFSFTATVPEMPVTVRLQLVFARQDRIPPEYRITLPPFRLEPKRDARPGDPQDYTFHVTHRGYSSLFQKPDLFTRAIVDKTWTITRVGTARFGTAIAIDDSNR
jgi:hypothetical protein